MRCAGVHFCQTTGSEIEDRERGAQSKEGRHVASRQCESVQYRVDRRNTHNTRNLWAQIASGDAGCKRGRKVHEGVAEWEEFMWLLQRQTSGTLAADVSVT